MKKLFAILVVLVLLVFFTTVFIVDETEQVVVLAFGKAVKTITKPGLNFKLPAPLQVAVTFDKRLLEYDVPPEEVTSEPVTFPALFPRDNQTEFSSNPSETTLRSTKF